MVRLRPRHAPFASTDARRPVIRLKQVEHVRNERNVLAKVAGHPFITTMVASFQSLDSLYMVVRSGAYRQRSSMTDMVNSSTTAPAAKSSATCGEHGASTSPPHSSMLPRLSLS